MGAGARMSRKRRRRRIWPGIAAGAVAAALVGGGLAYFTWPGTTASKPVGAMASVPVPGPSTPSPPPTSRTASTSPSSPGSGQAAAQPDERGTPQTNPLLAKKYAEQSVGNCLEIVWSNYGNATMFDSYLGNGVVQFSTGTSASPTGNFAEDTLIDVRVDADGSVTGIPAGGAGAPPAGPTDSDLDYWGCHPGNQTPMHPTQRPPAHLQAAGVLRVGCTVTYNDYSEADGAAVTMYNPTGSPVTVNDFGIEWGSNGILLSESGPITYGTTIYPGEVARSWVSGAPVSAHSCFIAGWG